MAKNKTEDKLTVKQFRDNSSNFWVDNKHYYLSEDNELHLAAGGINTDEVRAALLAYIKRNKKTHIPRKKIEPEKEYLEIITFGKHTGKTVQEVFTIEKSYLVWIKNNYNFSLAQENLKKEITEILL